MIGDIEEKVLNSEDIMETPGTKICMVKLEKINLNDFKDGDSDEDLPALPFLLAKMGSERKIKPSNEELMKEHENRSKNIQLENVSDKLIEERLKIIEEIQTDEVENISRSSTPIEVNEDRNFKVLFINDTLQYFNMYDITLEQCGYDSSNISLTEYERTILSFKRVELERVLSSSFFSSVYCVSDLKSFLTFLLRNLSVSADIASVEACYNVLNVILEKHSGTKTLNFSSADIFMLLFNYGTNIDSFKFLEKRTNIQIYLEEPGDKSRSRIPEKWMVNLKMILNAIICLINNCKFKTVDLSDIIIALLWLSLDSSVLYENLYTLIRECINACLENVQADKWSTVMREVVNTFITEDFVFKKHEWLNIYHMAEAVPVTSRGIELRKYISCYVLRQFGNMKNTNESPEGKVIKTLNGFSLMELQSLLQNLVQDKSENSPAILNHFSKFLNLCISHLDATDEDIEKLCNILKNSEKAINQITREANVHVLKILARLKITLGNHSMYNVISKSNEASFIKIKQEVFCDVDYSSVPNEYSFVKVKEEPVERINQSDPVELPSNYQSDFSSTSNNIEITCNSLKNEFLQINNTIEPDIPVKESFKNLPLVSIINDTSNSNQEKPIEYVENIISIDEDTNIGKNNSTFDNSIFSTEKTSSVENNTLSKELKYLSSDEYCGISKESYENCVKSPTSSQLDINQPHLELELSIENNNLNIKSHTLSSKYENENNFSPSISIVPVTPIEIKALVSNINDTSNSNQEKPIESVENRISIDEDINMHKNNSTFDNSIFSTEKSSLGKENTLSKELEHLSSDNYCGISTESYENSAKSSMSTQLDTNLPHLELELPVQNNNLSIKSPTYLSKYDNENNLSLNVSMALVTGVEGINQSDTVELLSNYHSDQYVSSNIENTSKSLTNKLEQIDNPIGSDMISVKKKLVSVSKFNDSCNQEKPIESVENMVSVDGDMNICINNSTVDNSIFSTRNSISMENNVLPEYSNEINMSVSLKTNLVQCNKDENTVVLLNSSSESVLELDVSERSYEKDKEKHKRKSQLSRVTNSHCSKKKKTNESSSLSSKLPNHSSSVNKQRYSKYEKYSKRKRSKYDEKHSKKSRFKHEKHNRRKRSHSPHKTSPKKSSITLENTKSRNSPKKYFDYNQKRARYCRFKCHNKCENAITLNSSNESISELNIPEGSGEKAKRKSDLPGKSTSGSLKLWEHFSNSVNKHGSNSPCKVSLKNRNSPKRYFDYKQKKAHYSRLKHHKKSIMTQIDLNHPTLLKDTLLPSSSNCCYKHLSSSSSCSDSSISHPSSTCYSNSSSTDSDSDVVQLYCDPKNYADPECAIVYESCPVIVLDSD